MNVMYDFNRTKAEYEKKKSNIHTYTFPSSNKNTQMHKAIAAHNELGHTISIFSCFVWTHHDACVIAQDINAIWELLFDFCRGRPHLHTYIHACINTHDICTYLYTHTNTHAHTHTHILSLSLSLSLTHTQCVQINAPHRYT